MQFEKGKLNNKYDKELFLCIFYFYPIKIQITKILKLMLYKNYTSQFILYKNHLLNDKIFYFPIFSMFSVINLKFSFPQLKHKSRKIIFETIPSPP